MSYSVNNARTLPVADYRIYVASLSDYNAGELHGAWIDCDGKTDEQLCDEVNKILRASKHPNITKRDWACNDCGHEWSAQVQYSYNTIRLSGEKSEWCPKCDGKNVSGSPHYDSAEEYAIHDHEGFGSLIGEYTPLSEVAAIIESLESAENPKALQEFAENYGYSITEAAERFDDAYHGQWDSELEFAENFIDECGYISEIPDHLQSYFDYEAFSRDLFFDYTMTDSGYVFCDNH